MILLRVKYDYDESIFCLIVDLFVRPHLDFIPVLLAIFVSNGIFINM